jgi:hypothetical protein
MGPSVRLKGVFRRLLSHDCSSSKTRSGEFHKPVLFPLPRTMGEREQRTVMSSYRLEPFEE